MNTRPRDGDPREPLICFGADVAPLDQGQEPGGAGREARDGRGLGHPGQTVAMTSRHFPPLTACRPGATLALRMPSSLLSHGGAPVTPI